MKLVNNRYKDFFERLVETSDQLGLSLRPYSGRGMYGKSCPAIVIDDMTDLLRLGVELGVNGLNETGLPGTSTDSMGRDIVVYWPSVKVEVEEGDEDEENED